MALEIPQPIADYFAADKGDGEALAHCFTEAATVVDEEHTYSGRSEIARWRNEAAVKYNYTAEPIALEKRDGVIVVTAHLVGDFPGSPVDLTYSFILDGDKIASLEIV